MSFEMFVSRTDCDPFEVSCDVDKLVTGHFCCLSNVNYCISFFKNLSRKLLEITINVGYPIIYMDTVRNNCAWTNNDRFVNALRSFLVMMEKSMCE